MKKAKFWFFFENFLKKYVFNRKIFIPIIVGVFIVIIIIGIISYNKERSATNIQGKYINAFYKLKTVSDKVDDLNKERIGIAIRDLEKTVEMPGDAPEKYLAYINLGELYLKLKQKEIAVKYLEKAKDAPKDLIAKPLSFIMLGRIYLEDSKLDNAIDLFNYVIKNYDGYFKDTALYYKGIAYEIKNNIDMAISSYKMIDENSVYSFEAKKNIEVIERLKRLEVSK